MTLVPDNSSSGQGRIASRRCVRHEEREAVGRCTICAGGFCRECITEHEGRLYCGSCFVREFGAASQVESKPRDWKWLRRFLTTAGSVGCLLLLFYLLGRVLSAIPARLHDGTVWKEMAEP